MSVIVSPTEFHLSFRVADLQASTAFHTAFLGVEPKDRTARFSTFVVPHLALNLGAAGQRQRPAAGHLQPAPHRPRSP